jgi:hypothetical protein
MVTKRADQVDESVLITDKIATAIRCLGERKAYLEQELFKIERMGWCEAKPYYRNGKYLILVHPMVNGERVREYIGGDPEKIQDALDKVSRKDEYEALGKQLADVDCALSRVRMLLMQAFNEAYSVKW